MNQSGIRNYSRLNYDYAKKDKDRVTFKKFELEGESESEDGGQREFEIQEDNGINEVD